MGTYKTGGRQGPVDVKEDDGVLDWALGQGGVGLDLGSGSHGCGCICLLSKIVVERARERGSRVV